MKYPSVLIKEVNTTAPVGNKINISSTTALDSAISFGDFSVKMVVSGEERYCLNGSTFVVRAGEHVAGNAMTEASVEINCPQPSIGICAYLSYQLLSEVADTLIPYEPGLIESLQSDQLFVSKVGVEHSSAGKYLQTFANQIDGFDINQITLSNDFFFRFAECVIRDQAKVRKVLDALEAKKWKTNTYALRRLLDAKAYIHENFYQSVDIQQIAVACGLSEYHFIRLFKKAFHYTPYQYLIRTRLSRAATLLAKRVAATEVAFRVGFADLASFSKAFKKHYGLSPRAFQQKSSF